MGMNVLNKVNSPEDLKKLTQDELVVLADEIREVIINKVSQVGGHFGPNLGMVEATIALHYVFNSPVDKIVYDVSHQCYPHKILTGRKHGFIDPNQYRSITGYTSPKESEHDFFTIGHTSTSISLACGLAKARDIKGAKENIIAVIGDGSLSGGEAYEGLNNAAASGKNMIILVNDNEMSIAVNYGGLYQNLAELRRSKGECETNFFKALGFDYHYIEDGHDLVALIDVFSKVKDTNHPVVIHMSTVKGKGYKPAEINKEAFHYTGPFDLESGELLHKPSSENYVQITSKFLIEKAKLDAKVVAITAGTPGIFGPSHVREGYGDQLIDVGIAEEHAIALASGLASQGMKPVVGFHSSFIQRTYDQLSQDLAINNHPAVILIFNGGISGTDVTHLGVFDISLVSNIPNIVYLAPTTKEEYLAMVDWGLEQNEHPVVIRVPNRVVSTTESIKPQFDDINRYQLVEKGHKVAILALGSFYQLGEKVLKTVKDQIGLDATLINPRFASGIDESLLTNLLVDHQLVITLEDGILDGGFGEKISRFYADKSMRVLNYGANKEFTDRVNVDELYERYRLRVDLIVEDIKKHLD